MQTSLKIPAIDLFPMRRISGSILYLVTLCKTLTWAQEGEHIDPLKIGDQMPDYTFVNLINHETPTARLTDFQGKMIILDFWSTGCASCIESWPGLLKLQKRFHSEIQIILINAFQDEKTVRTIFDKRKRLAGIDVTLPTVCGDSRLARMFPSLGVPHIVWIDKKGIIQARTYGALLTESNIEAVLKDPSFRLPEAATKPPSFSIDYMAPLFLNGNAGYGEGIVLYSALSRYVENVRSGTMSMKGNIKTRQYYRITAVNVPVMSLYAYAFSSDFDSSGQLRRVPDARIVIEGLDSLSYVAALPADGILRKENIYTYDLIADTIAHTQLQKMMRADLNRHFGYYARWEKRKKQCLVLRIDDTTKIHTPTGRLFPQAVNESKFSLNGTYRMDEIVEMLQALYYDSRIPIVDETNFAGAPYGVEIEVDTRNWQALDSALRPYGMSFRLEKRKIDMLVISGKGAPTSSVRRNQQSVDN